MIRRAAAALFACALLAAASPAQQAALLAQEATALETRLAGLRAEMRALAEAQADAAGIAGEKSRRALATLSALTRLSEAPPAAFLLHPDGPEAGLLGAAALRAASGALQERAVEAQARLKLIEALGSERRKAQDALRAAATELTALTTEIERLRGGEATLRLTAAENAAREARSVTAALDRLTPIATKAASAAPPWPWPVAPRAAAPAGDGMALAATPGALVVSPAAASLRFAGHIPGHGAVAVLEPQQGVLAVLTGLARIDAKQGATLAPGEPFGAMPRLSTGNDDAELAAKAGVTLYIEMRRDGALEDPRAWFGPSQGRDGGE